MPAIHDGTIGAESECRYRTERDHMHDWAAFAVQIKQTFGSLHFGCLETTGKPKMRIRDGENEDLTFDVGFIIVLHSIGKFVDDGGCSLRIARFRIDKDKVSRDLKRWFKIAGGLIDLRYRPKAAGSRLAL